MTSKQLESDSNYKLICNIGKGAFGIVSKIKIKEDKSVVALKEIDLTAFHDPEKQKELLEESRKEYKLLSTNLKNVVLAIGSFYDEKKKHFLFTMEFFPKNLKQHVECISDNHSRKLKFDEFFCLFQDITTGLNSLYKEKVVHRDLKPENILINEKCEAFIADVGAAKYFENTICLKMLQSIKTVVGTESWMAPEMNKDDSGPRDLSKVDVFSLGLISLFCLDSKDYYNQKDLNKNARHLHEKYLSEFRTGKREQDRALAKIPKGFYYFLKCMLSYDPNTRPSVEEIDETVKKFAKSFHKKKNGGEGAFAIKDREKEKVDLLNKRIEELIQTLNEKEQVIKSLNEDILSNRESSIKFRSELDTVTNENLILHEKLEDMEQSIVFLKRDNEHLQQLISKHEVQNKEKDLNNKELSIKLENELNILRKENIALRGNLEKMQNSNEYLKRKNEELEEFISKQEAGFQIKKRISKIK